MVMNETAKPFTLGPSVRRNNVVSHGRWGYEARRSRDQLEIRENRLLAASDRTNGSMNSTAHDYSLLFVELGSIVVGLALLARWASKWGFSSIPLYLLAGLAFGNGGILPLNLSKDFIAIGAEIGVLLLLFMLGLEYSGAQLQNSIRTGLAGGVVDFLLNFPPGYLTGVLMGWTPLAAFLMGGVSWISSSGIVAKVLSDLGRLSYPDTPTVLSVLVIEDLAMAIYLPMVAVLLVGGGGGWRFRSLLQL